MLSLFCFETFPPFPSPLFDATFPTSFYTCFVYSTLLTLFPAFVSTAIKHFIFRLQNEKLTCIHTCVYICKSKHCSIHQLARYECMFFQPKVEDIFRFYFYATAAAAASLFHMLSRLAPSFSLFCFWPTVKFFFAKQIVECVDVQSLLAALRCHTVFMEVSLVRI